MVFGGICVVFVWYLWYLYGICMVFVVFVWYLYGICIVFVVFVWYLGGILVEEDQIFCNWVPITLFTDTIV